MNHVISHISEYLDNALAAQERRAVEQHLEQCKECSARFKELQALRQRLKTAPELTPPESFYQGVLQRIEEDKKPFLAWDWPMTTKALATFGVLMVVVMVAREARRSEPELFAPVSQTAAPEATPAPTAGQGQAVGVPVSAPPPPPANVNSAAVAEAKHAELPMKAKMSETDTLKQKAVRKIENDNEERERQKEAVAGNMKDEKTLELNKASGAPVAASRTASVGGALASNNVLQARDINGPATQGSFAQEQPQMTDKKAAFGALSKSAARSTLDQSTEWKGDSSAITNFKTVIITNDTDWKTLWAQHTQNQVPPPPVPNVDFSRFTVVGVFAGTEHSNDEIKITNIQNGPDSLTISYGWQAPGIAMGNELSLNRQPYDIRLTPKTSLPITFIKEP